MRKEAFSLSLATEQDSSLVRTYTKWGANKRSPENPNPNEQMDAIVLHSGTNKNIYLIM